MKLLPKKVDIDKAKVQERKMEVDAGLDLAKKVDSLRQAKDTEEKNLKEWREKSIKSIQYEIDQYLEERDNLKKQNDEARTLRNELLKPLNSEWEEVNKVKEELSKERNEIESEKETLKISKKNIELQQNKAVQIVAKSKLNEQETEKLKNEIVALKAMAQREYEISREKRVEQTTREEQTNLRLDELQKQYEVGITTNEIFQKNLEEKESELINKEKDLERQQKILIAAKEALHK